MRPRKLLIHATLDRPRRSCNNHSNPSMTIDLTEATVIAMFFVI